LAALLLAISLVIAVYVVGDKTSPKNRVGTDFAPAEAKPADPILPPMPLYAQLVEEKGTVALMTPVEPVPVKVTRRSNERV